MPASHSKWLLAALALATFASSAQATDRRHRHHLAPRPGYIAPYSANTYLDVGQVPDPGADQRYFEDSKFPRYEVGPSIFQRFESSRNEF